MSEAQAVSHGEGPAHGHGGHAVDIDRHVRIYVGVFAALMVLTLVTVGIYYIHLPVAAAIALALFVATVKASLVACFFMHLISEKKLIHSLLILTFAFFLVLLFTPVIAALVDDHPAPGLSISAGESSSQSHGAEH
jgi:cytochrome c oxidase subunit 4